LQYPKWLLPGTGLDGGREMAVTRNSEDADYPDVLEPSIAERIQGSENLRQHQRA
jgi:hypothetical protein